MSWKLVVVFATACAVYAQTGAGNIQGTVKDATGAVVPGANVTVTHKETARQYDTVANGIGFYLIPSVQMGGLQHRHRERRNGDLEGRLQPADRPDGRD